MIPKSKSEQRRLDLQGRQRVNIVKGVAMRAVYAMTAYQCVSLAVLCAVVFGQGASPWWLTLHLVGTLWYIVTTQVFLK